MVIESDAILRRFMFQEGSYASKVFGVLQESVHKYALFHVTPDVCNLGNIFGLHWVYSLGLQRVHKLRSQTLQQTKKKKKQTTK